MNRGYKQSGKRGCSRMRGYWPTLARGPRKAEDATITCNKRNAPPSSSSGQPTALPVCGTCRKHDKILLFQSLLRVRSRSSRSLAAARRRPRHMCIGLKIHATLEVLLISPMSAASLPASIVAFTILYILAKTVSLYFRLKRSAFSTHISNSSS